MGHRVESPTTFVNDSLVRWLTSIVFAVSSGGLAYAVRDFSASTLPSHAAQRSAQPEHTIRIGELPPAVDSHPKPGEVWKVRYPAGQGMIEGEVTVLEYQTVIFVHDGVSTTLPSYARVHAPKSSDPLVLDMFSDPRITFLEKVRVAD